MSAALVRRLAACLLAAATCLPLRPLAAQAQRTLVRYDVEFSTTGPLLDPNCTASGTDVLAGTLFGHEPPSPGAPSRYVGTLTRTTRIITCGERTLANGSEVVCSMTYTADGFADVILELEPGNRGGWLHYLDDRTPWQTILPPRPSGPVRNTVSGTCDPAEMALLETQYDDGSTAGSPNGQPIEVSSLPPSTYPYTFAASPPVSIWTLKVLRRRP